MLRDVHAAEQLLEGNDPVIEQGAMASLEDDQEVYLLLSINCVLIDYAVLAIKGSGIFICWG